MRVVFIHPHRDKVDVGSYRLQTLQPYLFLLKNSVDVHIVQNIDEAAALQPDILICMQILDIPKAVMLRDVTPKLKLVAFQSDGPTIEANHFDKVDAIVVDCILLWHRIPCKYRTRVVHLPTPLEIEMSRFNPHQHPGRALKLGYVGAAGNLFFAEPIIDALVSKGCDVTIISDHSKATVPWNVLSYASELNKCDVGIVPYPENLQVSDDRNFSGFFYKDPSRPTLLQAIGLPIIVSPLPSYLHYVRPGQTGFIANSLSEWVDTIQFLQDVPEAYEGNAIMGYQQSWQYCAPDIVGQRWLQLLVDVRRQS